MKIDFTKPIVGVTGRGAKFLYRLQGTRLRCNVIVMSAGDFITSEYTVCVDDQGRASNDKPCIKNAPETKDAVMLDFKKPLQFKHTKEEVQFVARYNAESGYRNICKWYGGNGTEIVAFFDDSGNSVTASDLENVPETLDIAVYTYDDGSVKVFKRGEEIPEFHRNRGYILSSKTWHRITI